jgi:hypothetical protein
MAEQNLVSPQPGVALSNDRLCSRLDSVQASGNALCEKLLGVIHQVPR